MRLAHTPNADYPRIDYRPVESGITVTDLNEAIAFMIIETLELEQLKASDIGPNDLLFGDDGLGLDSVDALELVVEIERRFGFQLQEDAASREVLMSVASMATWIQQQQAAVSPAG